MLIDDIGQREKETVFAICIINFEEQISNLTKEFVRNWARHHIFVHSDEEQSFYEKLDVRTFYENAEYHIAQIRYLLDVGKALGFELQSYQYFRSECMKKIVQGCVGNFNWDEMRFLTDHELWKRDQRLLKIAKEIMSK